MTQTITTQRELTCRHYIRLYGLILSFLLSGYFGLQAQKVAWESGYPKMAPVTMAALGDPASIEAYFTVTQNIPNAKLEIKLPANVEYGTITNGTNHSSGITYTTNSSGTVVTGQVVTVTITSNGGTLTAGQAIDLNVNVSAKCIENTTLSTEFKVFSGATEAQDGVKSVPTPVRKPTIRLQATTSAIAGGATSTTKSFSMTLDAQNVPANSLKITFSTDQYTTLSNFKLGANTLTEVASGSNPKLYTVVLNTTNMGGVLNTALKTLTFDVVSTRCGAHNITSAIQYPETSVCATSTGTPLSITYDGVAGMPRMDNVNFNWVSNSDLDLPISGLTATSLDGTTPAWFRAVYKNTGSTDSYNTTVTYSASATGYAYMLTDQIQYAIGTGPKKLLKDNGIIQKTGFLVNNSYLKFKPEALGQCRAATLVITEPIPPGETVYFYFPNVQGDIFDNSSLTESTIMTSPYMWLQYTTYPIAAYENACGVRGANPPTAYGKDQLTIPKFSSSAQAISLRSGGFTGSTKFSFRGSSYANTSVDMNIQLPSWLELDGSTLSDALVFASTTITKQEILVDNVNKKYTLRISGDYNGFVTLKYKSVATCPDPVNENKEDKVILSIDYNTSNGDPLRPTLKKIGQLIIPATLLCKEAGFVMNNFSILRTSIGLKDTNNKNLAEDGSDAPENMIDHTNFMQYDEGKMVYEGKISGSSFDNLYILLSCAELNLASNVSLLPGTLEIGANSYPVTFIPASDNKHYYLKYTGSDIVNGANVKITLPFTLTQYAPGGISFKGEGYTSNDEIPATSVFSPTDHQRNGDDIMFRTIYSYAISVTGDLNSCNVNIPDNMEREFLVSNLRILDANNFPSPFYINEYRVLGVPTKFDIIVPDGILVDETDLLRMRVNTAMDAHALANRDQRVSLISSTIVPGGTKYTYDLHSAYDPSYDLTQGSLPVNKWAYPAEKWDYIFYLNMIVSRGASSSNPFQCTAYYDNKTTNAEVSIPQSFVVGYTGMRTTLDVSPTSIETYSANVSIPSVSPGNPNTIPVRMWLYVEGDVKDAKATPVGGGTPIGGSGYNNCWIPLGTVAPNDVPAYSVDFTYTGSGDCSAYDVKIYTISDFGDGSFSPAINSAMVFDIDHNGASKVVKVTPNPNAKLTGTISVPISTVLAFHTTPYTLTATFNSVASEAGVNNAEMLITVPAGQAYVPNSAKFVYPTTATPAAAASIEAALVSVLGASSNLTVARTFSLKASDLGVSELPGYKVIGFDDFSRELKVTMDFTSECGTEMSGIRFNGTLSGKNPCGGAVDPSDVRTTQLIYTNVNSAYGFDVTAQMDAAGPVFNEQKTTGTLTVTAKKLANDPIQAADYLLITMPDVLDVTGGVSTVNLTGTLSGITTATISSNTAFAGIRTLKLTLPTTQFNGATNAGNGLNVNFMIPLTYTADAQTYAATPVQKIEPRILSNQKFDSTCPGSSEIAIGQAELDIALLTAEENPYMACLNTEATLKITSTGFQGAWYDNAGATGTALSTIDTYTLTPNSLTAQTFYVSAIFGGVTYGIVPVVMEMNPEATLAVSAPAAQCAGSVSVDLTSRVSGTPSPCTVKYYCDLACTDELIGSACTVSPTTNTTYYVQVTTNEGCKSPVTALAILVNPTPSMTKPGNVRYCQGATPAIALNGTNVTHYTWSGGSTLGLADETGTNSYTTIPSFTAVNTGTTAVSATVTVTPQHTANSVTCAGTSQTFILNINPTPVAGTFSDVALCSGKTQGVISPVTTTEKAVTFYTWRKISGSNVGLNDYTNADNSNLKTIPGFTAPTVTAVTTATFEVTPHFKLNNVDCPGTPVEFTVTINPLPVVTLITDKTNDEVCVNTNITFTTESGMGTYVWDFGTATLVSGGTATDHTATVKWTTSGTPSVSVNYTNTNGCTAISALSKSVTVHPATAFSSPLTVTASRLSNGFITPGSNVVLEATSTGHSLTYQWYWKKLSDGTVVTLTNTGKYSGVTSSQLTISNAYEEENGDYYVTVTGTCGTETSNPVTVITVANQDASLKDLKVNGVTLPDFNPAKTDYMTTVVCNDEQVTILGVPNNSNVTSITGNGTFSLQPGDNIFNIIIVAQDMVTTMTYTVNVIRDCYVPKILKDIEDAVICVGNTHTFEIEVEGQGLTYEWYYGLNRIMGASTNTYTVNTAELRDYERYQVVIRSNYNGFKSSAYSKKVRLWVADYLPTTLKFAEYPSPATTGNTYHIKVDGYIDVTKYTWSYDKEGVTFSPGADQKWGNEAWATFGTLSAGTGTLKVTMEHPCGTRELSQAITVKYPTGTEDITAEVVQVYPNPTSGVLKVSGTESDQTIRVTDVTGSVKGTYKTQEGTTTIDLTGYAKGTYMVQYNGKTYKVIRK